MIHWECIKAEKVCIKHVDLPGTHPFTTTGLHADMPPAESR